MLRHAEQRAQAPHPLEAEAASRSASARQVGLGLLEPGRLIRPAPRARPGRRRASRARRRRRRPAPWRRSPGWRACPRRAHLGAQLVAPLLDPRARPASASTRSVSRISTAADVAIGSPAVARRSSSRAEPRDQLVRLRRRSARAASTLPAGDPGEVAPAPDARGSARSPARSRLGLLVDQRVVGVRERVRPRAARRCARQVRVQISSVTNGIIG